MENKIKTIELLGKDNDIRVLVSPNIKNVRDPR